MSDDQCSTCGVGFYLPSGVCDHCNTRKKVSDEVIKAWAERHGFWGPSLADLRCAFEDAQTTIGP